MKIVSPPNLVTRPTAKACGATCCATRLPQALSHPEQTLRGTCNCVRTCRSIGSCKRTRCAAAVAALRDWASTGRGRHQAGIRVPRRRRPFGPVSSAQCPSTRYGRRLLLADCATGSYHGSSASRRMVLESGKGPRAAGRLGSHFPEQRRSRHRTISTQQFWKGPP